MRMKTRLYKVTRSFDDAFAVGSLIEVEDFVINGIATTVHTGAGFVNVKQANVIEHIVFYVKKLYEYIWRKIRH